MNQYHPIRNRDGAHTGAHQIIADLTDLGLTIPAPIAVALAALIKHQDRQPQPVDHGHVRKLYADGAPDKTITEALAYAVAYNDRRNAWTQARADLGVAVHRAILNHADDIHPQLADLADRHIDHLTRAAHLDEPLVGLVRDGRTDDAQLLATADVAATHLAKLYDINIGHLTPPGTELTVGHYTATQWQDPETVRGKDKGETLWAAWRAGIRAGGQLWYPTWDQALNTATRAWDRYKKLHPREKVSGGIVAFT